MTKIQVISPHLSHLRFLKYEKLPKNFWSYLLRINTLIGREGYLRGYGGRGRKKRLK